MDLVELLKRPEGKTLEFKRDLSSPETSHVDKELALELQRFARGVAFDEQPMLALNSEALDFRVASESFGSVRQLRHVDLEILRLVTKYQERTVPTVGGMLLFGRDREKHFPDAWIQVGRFSGTDKRHIIIGSTIVARAKRRRFAGHPKNLVTTRMFPSGGE